MEIYFNGKMQIILLKPDVDAYRVILNKSKGHEEILDLIMSLYNLYLYPK